MKYCVKCGCEIKETNMGRFYCPNCGIIEANQDIEEDHDDKTPIYIG